MGSLIGAHFGEALITEQPLRLGGIQDLMSMLIGWPTGSSA